LCSGPRPVLHDVTVAEQRAMKDASKPGFSKIASNDATLKAYVVLLERVIQTHDEPLGGCD
jgi:hypothetical protein